MVWGRKWHTEGLRKEKFWGMMAKLWKEMRISRRVKQELYERVVIPTMVYGSERWLLIKGTGEEKNRSI